MIGESILSAHAPGGSANARLGSVTLHPHQLRLLERVQAGLERHGGVLLAESVGRGKTFVALAAAREYQQVTIVCPASIVTMWQSSLRLASLQAAIVSTESLSRAGGSVGDPAGIVIVDEAHHFRNPRSARFGQLRSLCFGSHVLLLSATPIHNAERELRTVLSLFLGATAEFRPLTEIAQHVIRSAVDADVDRAVGMDALPTVIGPEWLEAGSDEHSLDDLLALPSPVPPADGGDGGVLLTYTLLRQWSSSRAALRGALQRRLLRTEALANAVEQGRLPSRQELAAWATGDGTVQLCFAELLVATPLADARATDPAARLRDLGEALETHRSAVRRLLADIDVSPNPDDARADAVRFVATSHPGEKIVVFTSFAETAASLYGRLAVRMRCGVLTGRSARVAGGTLSRREALRRFAPTAQRAVAPAEAERIDVLITTDILSEGCNLQDASVVVHADLPWTPARLEQRVGRVRRLGSTHAGVSVYVLRPPATAERLIEVEARLRQKLSTAMRGIGVSGAILPGLGGNPDRTEIPSSSAAESLSRLIAWAERADTEARRRPGEGEAGSSGRRRGVDTRGDHCMIHVATVDSDIEGWVALVRDGGRTEVIACDGRSPPSSACGAVVAVLERAGPGVHAAGRTAGSTRAIESALAAVSGELKRRESAKLAGIETARLARARSRLLRRLAVTGGRLPRWKRVELLPLLSAGHRLATQVLPAGAERVLDELADAQLEEEPWLRAVAAFTEAHSVDRSAGPPDSRRPVALLLLVPRPDPGCASPPRRCCADRQDRGLAPPEPTPGNPA
jgi:superfamily II DNA or RNA helicase